jgi:hypothetical protein
MELAPGYYEFVGKVNASMKLVVQVRDKIRQQIRYFKARKQKLEKAFIEEVENYQYELLTSRLKADRELGAKFTDFKWHYAFKLLSLYLERCV